MVATKCGGETKPQLAYSLLLPCPTSFSLLASCSRTIHPFLHTHTHTHTLTSFSLLASSSGAAHSSTCLSCCRTACSSLAEQSITTFCSHLRCTMKSHSVTTERRGEGEERKWGREGGEGEGGQGRGKGGRGMRGGEGGEEREGKEGGG